MSKLKSKFIPIILLVCSVVFIAGYFVMTPSYITQNGDVRHFSDGDLSFDLPSNWTVYEYDDPIKTPFLSNNPKSIILNPGSNNMYSYNQAEIPELDEGEVLNTSTTNATDVVIVKSEITKVDSLAEGTSLETAYKTDSVYGMMESNGQFNINSSTPMQVSGKNAYQFVYSDTSTMYKDTWIEDDGHYIRILSQAPNSVYSDAEPIFDNIVNTLVIK